MKIPISVRLFSPCHIAYGGSVALEKIRIAIRYFNADLFFVSRKTIYSSISNLRLHCTDCVAKIFAKQKSDTLFFV